MEKVCPYCGTDLYYIPKDEYNDEDHYRCPSEDCEVGFDLYLRDDYFEDIIINDRFKKLLSPLNSDEYKLLEQSIIEDGCREALVYGRYKVGDDWEYGLLDGHNRLKICRNNAINFDIHYFTFDSEEEAYNWIINNQLGRRNVTPEQASYLRGKRYEVEKKTRGAPVGNDNASEQRGNNFPFEDSKKTAQILADEYKVSDRTIKNDATFARSVNALADQFGDNIRTDILSRGSGFTKKDVNALAKETELYPDRAKYLIDRIKSGQAKNIDEAKKQLAHQEPEPKQKNYITLTEWDQGQRLEPEPVNSSMNKVNENIEWAAFSWNPITGCLHNCKYCYARDIANRFYKQGFEPSFLPERLSQPANTRPIAPRWDGDIGHRNIFTCSMADLFGKWVPVEWINSVLEVIRDNPQWTFLLLTKFPVRMAEFDYPDNVWLGTSVDYQWAVDRAEKAFTKIKASGFNGVCWLSCEPMMERLTFNSLDMFDWVVMGGSSRSSQTPEYIPPYEDINHLYNQARKAGCKIYFKTNLIPGMNDSQRVREYPSYE